MGLPTGRGNARSGRVCMFVCANLHAPFLSKAPYRLRIVKTSGYTKTAGIDIPIDKRI